MHHLAIDIGASSGRILHGQLLDDKLNIQEIHRFKNGFQEMGSSLFWDIDYLYNEIINGLKIAKSQGISHCTLGIDTWAVDYVLLDENGERLQPVFAYRDKRTEHTMDKVFSKINAETIYNKTGIQFLSFNTLFQLYEEDRKQLALTDSILLVPDYLNFLLTGRKTMELTNASTTQLLNIESCDFDDDLLELLALKRQQFPILIEPGEEIGKLRTELLLQHDLPDATVIAVASHDTASAVVGTPSESNDWAYLSSGTWSLVGTELTKPVVSAQSLNDNFTNEYGANQTYRFLKNIMGLWVIQEVQRLLPDSYTFSELVELAKEQQETPPFIQLNDNRFLNPVNMIEEIQSYCRETNQSIPTSGGQLAAAVYHNLAILTSLHLDQIAACQNHPISVLHIVGGGAHNDYLNQLIANYSQRLTYAGPTEATAIGNLLIQLLSSNEITSIKEGRNLIKHSFEVKCFEPEPFDFTALFNEFHTITATKSEENI